MTFRIVLTYVPWPASHYEVSIYRDGRATGRCHDRVTDASLGRLWTLADNHNGECVFGPGHGVDILHGELL